MVIIVEDSHTLTPAGTIGTHSLTVAELPAHTHGRGTTEITGGGMTVIYADTNGSKALTSSNTAKGEVTFQSNGAFYRAKLNFKASSGWAGTSQSIGSGTAHGHSWTGTASTFSLLNPYKCVYCFYRVS